MAVLTHVSSDLVQTFLEPYRLPPLVSLRGIAAGSVNTNYAVRLGDGEYFLRIYEEQDAAGAKREAKLLSHLSREGLPVACPIEGAEGTLGQILGKPAALFPWVHGEMRCQKSVTPQHTAKVGAVLGKIHLASAPLAAESGAGRFTAEHLLRRLPTIAAAGTVEMRELAGWLERALLGVETARRALPQSVIHGDMFRDNVLFREDGEIAVVLDFESASVGAMVFDLAVTLLSWCFDDTWERSLATALVAGYESVRPLSGEERGGLWGEASFAALRFLTTRVTDYELRKTEGPRVQKDWRRFRMRFDFLERVGSEALERELFPTSGSD